LDKTDANLDASTVNVNLNASQENAGSSPRGSAAPKLDKDVFGPPKPKRSRPVRNKSSQDEPGHVRDREEPKREADELRGDLGTNLKDQIRE